MTYLEKLAELEKGATCGKWRTVNTKKRASVVADECVVYAVVDDFGAVKECVERWHTDARLIAFYRNTSEEVARLIAAHKEDHICPQSAKFGKGACKRCDALSALDAKVEEMEK